MPHTNYTPEDIINFWFVESGEKDWFSGHVGFDQDIAQRFLHLHEHATLGHLADWRKTAEGRLAEIIILDQFSRNLFRHTADQFAYDAMALTLAQEAVRGGFDYPLPPRQRLFLYMPFMHSESAAIHAQAVLLFEDLGLPENLAYEHRHKDIIDRFGRYPHRNAVLGRTSTAEEEAFLQTPDSHF